MKILFLYTSLAGYFISCIHELSKQVDEIHIVRRPVNKNAPFIFTYPENVHIYERNEYTNNTLMELATKINPDKIICSGWIDKGYLNVCRVYMGKIPTVMSMDNHWFASPRQKLLYILAPLTLHRCFSHAWVPGDPQRKYALKLKFTEDKIKGAFYSADTKLFSNIYLKTRLAKIENFPKRMIYIGRYVEKKGVVTLWNAFVNAVEQTGKNWELWCLGTGDLYGQRKVHPQIKHFGFVQPNEMESFIVQTSVFVLPSIFEPWGVVVHEMAAAGMPLLCSDQVGAASMFLENGKNGYQFPAKNEIALTELMVKIMNKSDEDLLKMGEHSHKLAQLITQKAWVDAVVGF